VLKYKFQLRKILPYIFAYLCILPIGLEISGDTVSANYFFILFPFATFLFTKKKISGNSVDVGFLFYSLFLFLISIFYLFSLDFSLFTRSIISGILHTGSLLYIFAPFKIKIENFLKIVFFAGLFYCIYAIYGFYISGLGLGDMAYLKGGLRSFIIDWPQRYIIVVFFAFFLNFQYAKDNKFYYLFSFLFLFIFILTYTRAVWISILVGLFSLVKINLDFLKFILIIFVLFLLVYSVETESINSIFNGISLAFNQTSEAVSDVGNLDDDSSEGSRLIIWRRIIDYIIFHPFGSGYLGAAFVIDYGAAHNQYIDILLRMGWIGLVFYMLLWYNILSFFWKQNYLRAALLSFFVFGLFHETTKLSYGAFIFFALYSYLPIKNRKRNK
jgi:O-antigen ligase